MKYDELVDLTQNILQTNYLSTYRLNLSDETFEHIDMGLRSDILNLKIPPILFGSFFKRHSPVRFILIRIFSAAPLFICFFRIKKRFSTAVLFCLKKFKGNVLTKFLPLSLFRKS